MWYYNNINWSDKVTVKTLTGNNETIENLKNVQRDTIVNISNGKGKKCYPYTVTITFNEFKRN